MGYHSHMSSEQLRQVVEQLPRVKLAHLPTPLEECPRLAKELTPGETGPALYIKRDDMTGLGMGGNKARHLEFHLGEVECAKYSREEADRRSYRAAPVWYHRVW